ncbi:uncharacterized protein LOC125052017 [Pieris napi]|uniref:uncharacterized protein LOC125052017 n=1 Tax=Pieris napi TaxID=78633 RepID=UPI001FBA5EAD|nr:uncharacterized protein LOC125052017 [Pieris napi]
MFFQVPVYFSIIFILVHGKDLDPGPQTLSITNFSSPTKAHRQFATKDAIVYLTPSQIKDLESGEAELRYMAPDQITINKFPINQREPYQNQESFHRHLENLNILKAPLIPETQLPYNHGKLDVKLSRETTAKYSQSLANFRVYEHEPLNLINKQTDWRPIIPVNILRQQNIYAIPIEQTENFDLFRILGGHKTLQTTVKHSLATPALIVPYEKVTQLHPVSDENIKHIQQLPAVRDQTQNDKQSFKGNVFINVDSPHLRAWKK